MHRIDGPGATVDNHFTSGNPTLGVQATKFTEEWFNAVQEEICGVVEGAGDTLDKPDNGQLFSAIQLLISTALGASTTPVGAAIPYGGIFAPTGFLMGAGQEVSRTTYATLLNATTGTATGSTTNGSATVSTVSVDFSQAGIVGAKIEGAGIPSNTTITAVTSNTFTLSANATATASGVSLRVFPHGNGNGSTTFNVQDWRGVAPFGRDNMGGTAANRVTFVGSTVRGDRLGFVGGDQLMDQHTHVQNPHDHSMFGRNTSDGTDNGVDTNDVVADISTGYSGAFQSYYALATSSDPVADRGKTSPTTAVNQDAGAGAAQNVPPARITNWIIKV